MAAPSSTLARLATTRGGALRVLQRRGLDVCAAGETTLEQACTAAGLDPAEVWAQIERESRACAPAPPWDELPIEAIVQHLVQHVHEPLRVELARLLELARAIEDGHAGEPGRPVGLAAHVAELREGLELHMQKEEQVLFPLLTSGRGARALVPIQAMEEEHHDHCAGLRRTRELTAGLTAPVRASASWRGLYERLEQLERDLMEHIHLENHVLFPRAARHPEP